MVAQAPVKPKKGSTAPGPGFAIFKRAGPLGDAGFRVARFVEKPDVETARAFLAEGGHHWNSGIFAFTAGRYLEELERHRPRLARAVREAAVSGRAEGRRFHPYKPAFETIEGESVDYAVMECTDRAAVVPVEMAWSDIGNWQALHAALDRDASGNAVRGPADLVDCRNVLVSSDGPRVSVIGLSDVIVVVDGDEVLVTSAAGAQQVCKLDGAANQ